MGQRLVAFLIELVLMELVVYAIFLNWVVSAVTGYRERRARHRLSAV